MPRRSSVGAGVDRFAGLWASFTTNTLIPDREAEFVGFGVPKSDESVEKVRKMKS